MISIWRCSETPFHDFTLLGVFPRFVVSIVLSSYCDSSGLKEGKVSQLNFFWSPMANIQRLYFALGAPCIVLGGIWAVLRHQTEAAAIASLYMLFFVTNNNI